ncbi:LacI family DNA-binding transcriptional regulator [Paenibacillus sp. GYB003]|uniref:LacI family DNA-binding transcriptional regulator n=1 Tax=Paenibacillus sp. GYB003 TaxID=2994392 RepID=UPI002F968992
MSYTIMDIAKLAGVSKSTVSRVVSGKGYISPEARAKVTDAIERLQYKPNAVARAMVAQRTYNIGVIVYRKDYPIVSHPVYGKIVDAILAEAEKLRYSVFVSTDKEMSLRSADYMMEKRVDGLVLISRLSQETIGRIDRFGIPYLMVNGTTENGGVLQLVSDDRESGKLAADHLFGLGHRRISVIAGPQDHRSHHLRYEGFCSRLNELGCAVAGESVRFSPGSTFEDGCASFRSVWERSHTRLPTAVFATNDMLAFGAIRVMQEKGLQVPHDISVIGSDNIDAAGYSTPPLTTVHTEKERIGRDAVSMLDRLIRKLEPSPSAIAYAPKLIVRGTTGPAKTETERR